MKQPPTQPSPYGFILDPPPPPKKSLFSGGTTKSRAIIVGGVAFLLITLALIIMAVLSSLGNSGVSELKNVYAEQQELIRIAEIGSKDAVGTDTRGFASTTLLSARTAQQQVQSLISSRGAKIKPEEANSKRNANVEDILSGASANNRYDEALTELLESRIASYNQALDAAYNTNSEQARQVLSEIYTGSRLLVKQTDN